MFQGNHRGTSSLPPSLTTLAAGYCVTVSQQVLVLIPRHSSYLHNPYRLPHPSMTLVAHTDSSRSNQFALLSPWSLLSLDSRCGYVKRVVNNEQEAVSGRAQRVGAVPLQKRESSRSSLGLFVPPDTGARFLPEARTGQTLASSLSRGLALPVCSECTSPVFTHDTLTSLCVCFLVTHLTCVTPRFTSCSSLYGYFRCFGHTLQVTEPLFLHSTFLRCTYSQYRE
jgi:hypothetical protein